MTTECSAKPAMWLRQLAYEKAFRLGLVDPETGSSRSGSFKLDGHYLVSRVDQT